MNELNLNELVVYQELINLQQENEKLKENYDRIYNENCKLRDNHNITDISLLDENEILDTQLGKYIEQKDEWVELISKFKKQQKEFIKYLEQGIGELEKNSMNKLQDVIESGIKDVVKEILNKYKEIIGDDEDAK